MFVRFRSHILGREGDVDMVHFFLGFGLSSATRERISARVLCSGRTLALFDLCASCDPQAATQLDFHSNVSLANAPTVTTVEMNVNF